MLEARFVGISFPYMQQLYLVGARFSICPCPCLCLCVCLSLSLSCFPPFHSLAYMSVLVANMLCEVILTGIRFLLFSSVSSLLVMNTSPEITRGCLVQRKQALLCYVPVLVPLDHYFSWRWSVLQCKHCLPAYTKTRTHKSQDGVFIVLGPPGYLHLLRPAHGGPSAPRRFDGNSRNRLARPARFRV